MKRLATITTLLALSCALWAVPCSGQGGNVFSGLPQAGGKEERFLDFTLPDPDGAPYSLGQFTGKKPVLLQFWATWCPNCRSDVPRVNEIHLGGAVQVVAVDVLESPKKVKAAVRSLGIRYPVLVDADGIVGRKYGVPGVPAYLLIDRSGIIVYKGHAIPDRIERFSAGR